jgi:hypothetical protein
MKSKSFLAFIAAFSIGSVIVYFTLRARTADVPAPLEPYVFKTFEPFELDDPEIKQFDENVRKLVTARNFKALDDLASKVSDERSRFKGGNWRIFEFDDILSDPLKKPADGAAWEAHVALVQQWVHASPRSIFARRALASAEVGYAFYFRGTKSADNVAESAWPKYLEHLEKAKDAIGEAGEIDAKYVGYYLTVLNIARLDGVDRAAFEKLYDEAITFEPAYEYFYKAKAHYLLPQWSGSFGESESYAERVKMSLGGDEGVKMYSLIIAELNRLSRPDDMTRHRILWDDVVKGFALLEAEFGPSRLRLNQLAKMSFSMSDHVTTCETFRRLDSPDAYEESVWGNVGQFNAVRAIAINDLCKGLQSPTIRRFPQAVRRSN